MNEATQKKFIIIVKLLQTMYCKSVPHTFKIKLIVMSHMNEFQKKFLVEYCIITLLNAILLYMEPITAQYIAICLFQVFHTINVVQEVVDSPEMWNIPIHKFRKWVRYSYISYMTFLVHYTLAFGILSDLYHPMFLFFYIFCFFNFIV